MSINWVRCNKDALDDNNYIRNTESPKYYIELLPARVKQLCGLFDSDWYLVVAGDRDIANDYFVIPYSVFLHLLRDEFLTPKGTANPKPIRWQFQLREKKMKLFPPADIDLSEEERSVDVSAYYADNSPLTT